MQTGRWPIWLGVLTGLSLMVHPSRDAVAECPFCDAVRPTLSQLREPADVVALAEVTAVGEESHSLAIKDVAMGEDCPQKLHLTLSFDASPGDLVLLLGERETAKDCEATFRWNDLAISSAAYDYLLAAPDLRKTTAERLLYFAMFLEHQDPAIAEDAYMEFAHAPYSDVAAVGDAFDGVKLRDWLTDANVPDLRKGFYALALALAGGSPDVQRANIAFLRDWVENPGDDFRRGLDGVMGALLLAEGNEALELIRKKFLENPDAANGHVRNAMAAIRFYYEFGEDPDTNALAESVACLLGRPAFATEAIVDLARWQAWETLPQVVALFAEPKYDATTKHAIIAYLLTCEQDQAIDELERLRDLDEEFVNAAEERFLLFGGIR